MFLRNFILELIDTLWNVNDNQQLLALLLRCFELIDTLWNVNEIAEMWNIENKQN